MRIGQAIALGTVGAILAYAVEIDVPGFDVNAAGAVLVWVAMLWLAIEIGLVVADARRTRPPRPRAAPAARPEPRASAPPHDPILPARRKPAAGPPADDAPTRAMPSGDDTGPTRVSPRRDGS